MPCRAGKAPDKAPGRRGASGNALGGSRGADSCPSRDFILGILPTPTSDLSERPPSSWDLRSRSSQQVPCSVFPVFFMVYFSLQKSQPPLGPLPKANSGVPIRSGAPVGNSFKPSLPSSSSSSGPQLPGSRSPRNATKPGAAAGAQSSSFSPLSPVRESPVHLSSSSSGPQLPGPCSPQNATKPVAAAVAQSSPLPLSSLVLASSGSLTGAALLSPSTPPTRPTSMEPASPPPVSKPLCPRSSSSDPQLPGSCSSRNATKSGAAAGARSSSLSPLPSVPEDEGEVQRLRSAGLSVAATVFSPGNSATVPLSPSSFPSSPFGHPSPAPSLSEFPFLL